MEGLCLVQPLWVPLQGGGCHAVTGGGLTCFGGVKHAKY